MDSRSDDDELAWMIRGECEGDCVV